MHLSSIVQRWRQLTAGLALVLSLALCAVAGRMNSTTALAILDASTPERRIAYITSLGWQVTGDELQEQVQLPSSFSSASYADYLAIQQQCGFDLLPYAGQTVTRYTYTVLNYPHAEQIVYLDLLVCQSQVIGGDVRASSLDGFMQGLNYPD